jgi:hypothetical protein
MNPQISIQRSGSGTMGPSHEESPSTRRSRSRIAMESAFSDHPQRQQRSSAPQHHLLTSDTPVGGARLFDLFYSLIFSLVHVALTVVLAPVLGNKGQQRHQSRRSHPPTESSVRSLPPNMGESDPELAMPGIESLSSGGNASYQPILKTQSLSRRCCGDNIPAPTDNNQKSVRFPAPERPRPPLGRIGLSSSSLTSSSSGSTASTSSSLTSEGGRERPSRLTPQTTSRRGNSGARMASSPFKSSRMAHSTYFLE